MIKKTFNSMMINLMRTHLGMSRRAWPRSPPWRCLGGWRRRLGAVAPTRTMRMRWNGWRILGSPPPRAGISQAAMEDRAMRAAGGSGWNSPQRSLSQRRSVLALALDVEQTTGWAKPWRKKAMGACGRRNLLLQPLEGATWALWQTQSTRRTPADIGCGLRARLSSAASAGDTPLVGLGRR